MYERILVPTDDAEEMESVFEHAAAIARPHDAEVHVVSVVDKRAFLTLEEEMKDDVERQLREQGAEATQRAADWFADAGVDVTTDHLSGDPADEIVRYASHADIDLVVMGTRRNDSQTMLGSVSQAVTDRAESPVLVVDIAADA